MKKVEKYRMKQAILYLIVSAFFSACTFNFELTSQRTALENQVMGVYQELDDEVLLLSTIRGSNHQTRQDSGGNSSVLFHRRNQEFNRDDIEELKQIGVIGERWDGLLEEVKDKSNKKNDYYTMELIRTLINEENSDRMNIWRYVLSRMPEGSGMTLRQIGESYGRAQLEGAVSGIWLKGKDGLWRQKI